MWVCLFSEVQDRVMLTGRHMVRDVFCKNCDSKLGWMYEYATDEGQRYKESRVILERALVTEADGMDESEPRPVLKASNRLRNREVEEQPAAAVLAPVALVQAPQAPQARPPPPADRLPRNYL